MGFAARRRLLVTVTVDAVCEYTPTFSGVGFPCAAFALFPISKQASDASPNVSVIRNDFIPSALYERAAIASAKVCDTLFMTLALIVICLGQDPYCTCIYTDEDGAAHDDVCFSDEQLDA